MQGIRSFYYNIRIYDNQVYGNSIAIGSAVTSASNLYGIQGTQNTQSFEEIFNNTIHDLIISGATSSADNVEPGTPLAVGP